jgi:hypothetical protein
MIQNKTDHSKLCNTEQSKEKIRELTTRILGMFSTHHTDERVHSPRNYKGQYASCQDENDHCHGLTPRG